MVRHFGKFLKSQNNFTHKHSYKSLYKFEETFRYIFPETEKCSSLEFALVSQSVYIAKVHIFLYIKLKIPEIKSELGISLRRDFRFSDSW